jgi:hypothetical protein
MKKANKAGKPSKAPTQKVRGQVNPILDMLKNMDEDVVDMLRQIIEKEMDFGPELFGTEDPVDLFAEYLESARRNEDERRTLADLLRCWRALKDQMEATGEPAKKSRLS